MKNQEILDDELLNNGKEVIDKRTQKPAQRTLIYFTIMLIVGCGMAFIEFKETLFPTGFSFYFGVAISVILISLFISFILEFFRFLIRKFKSKKSETVTLTDPFWFQIIEGAFAIWILLTVLKAIQLFLFR